MQKITKQQNIHSLFDILLSVQKYQSFYDHKITIDELLNILGKANDLEKLLNISYWVSFNPCNFFIYKFYKKYNLYFNYPEDFKRIDPRFKNSEAEISDTEIKYSTKLDAILSSINKNL